MIKGFFFTLILSSIAAFLCPTIVYAQENGTKLAQCKPFTTDEPDGVPVLSGPEYNVPALQFRFSAIGAQGTNVKDIRLFYVWQWLEYPYPDRPWGVWSDANNIVDCTTGAGGSTIIPSYIVKPKGWYSGKYARTPRFDRIEVVFDEGDCGMPRLIFDKSQVEKFKKHVAEISFTCGGIAKYKFVDP